MGLKAITPPDDAVVSLELVRLQCRLESDYTAEDELLTIYRNQAIERVQTQSGKALLPQTWEFTLDYWNTRQISVWGDGSTVYTSPPWKTDAITLPIDPVQSVSSIEYLDQSGELQTWDSSKWRLAGNRIYPVQGENYPATCNQIDAIKITFDAGHTDELVPSAAKGAVLLLAAHYYFNRLAVSDSSKSEIPEGVNDLIRTFSSVSTLFW